MIIDSPPVLMVTDASIIAPRTTGVLFVVGSAITRGRAARAALDELQRGGGHILGTVLNRAQIERHSFYFAPYASGGYVTSVKKPAGDRGQAAASRCSGGTYDFVRPRYRRRGRGLGADVRSGHHGHRNQVGSGGAHERLSQHRSSARGVRAAGRPPYRREARRWCFERHRGAPPRGHCRRC